VKSTCFRPPIHSDIGVIGREHFVFCFGYSQNTKCSRPKLVIFEYKNITAPFDSPCELPLASSPLNKKARLEADCFCTSGDGGNRTPVQTMLLWESTMRRTFLFVLNNVYQKCSKLYIVDTLWFFTL